MKEFYIASEYARLLIQYHDDHFPPVARPASSLVSKELDAFEPLPVALLAPYIDSFLAAETKTPIQWLLGEHIASNSQEMLGYAMLNASNLAEANEIAAQFIALLTNAVTLHLTYLKNGSCVGLLEAPYSATVRYPASRY
jgi:hypothetical protein